MAATPTEQAVEQAEEPSLFPEATQPKNGKASIAKKSRSKKSVAKKSVAKKVAKKAIAKKATAKKAAPAAKPTQKRGRKPGASSARYDGLRENIESLFSKNPTESYTRAQVQEEFPEAALSAISYHLRQLKDKRVLIMRGHSSNTQYSLASHDYRAARTDTPEPASSLAVASPSPRRADPAKVDLFASRQLESILLRMENANDSNTPLFTAFDIEFLRRLASR